MEKVGGYISYLALLENSLHFDDVLIVMAAEADARKLMELEQKAKRNRG